MKDVPSQFLAQIAAYLTYEDLSSLFRTSKSVYSKLSCHRRELPKMPIKMIATRSQRVNAIKFNIIWYANGESSSERSRTIRLVELPENYRKQQPFEQFCAQKDIGNEPVQSFGICLLEGLPSLIEFVLSIADIQTLQLDSLSDDHVKIIVRSMKRGRVVVNSDMELHSMSLGEPHLDLISICEPKSLVILVDDVPTSFYRLPAVRKLTKLIASTRYSVLASADLLSLSASTIHFKSHSNIDATHVLSFLTEWLESKREIESIEVSFPFIPINQWPIILSRLDAHLVKVSEIAQPRYRSPFSRTTLRRLSDGEELEFHFHERIFKMYYPPK